MALQNKKPISKVVICPDKFKGGLSSKEVASAIREGLENYFRYRQGMESVFIPPVELQTVEMADGGDGSAELFGKLAGAEEVFLKVCGPLGEEVESSYMLCSNPSCILNNLPNSGKTQLTLEEGPSAFIECAKVCGLVMVPKEKQNPLKTTSFGIGQMIADAIRRGASVICIGLGGSATNDCGLGMLQGLGFSLGLPVGVKATGGNISEISSVEDPHDKVLCERLKKTRFLIINDVNNPLCGPDGATYVYSAQKGADKQSMAQMDRDMKELVLRQKKTSLSRREAYETANLAGAGAAGGLGFAFMQFLGAETVSGFSFFGDMLQNLSAKTAEADLVITGEGAIDRQSLFGKVVGHCCKCVSSLPEASSKRVWLFCGKGNLSEDDIRAACGKSSVSLYQLFDIERDLNARMKREYPLLVQMAYFAAMEMDALL